VNVITFCDNDFEKELYFCRVGPKRKQALPEGNLPAIRPMATIVEAG
jgi:hypothetical protein